MQDQDTPRPTQRLTLTVPQVRAELGGMSHRTIYRLLRTGELPSVLIGGRRLVRTDDLARFVAGKVGANPPARRLALDSAAEVANA